MMRFSRLWIRLLSILVPGEDRAEWVEEWKAEMAASGAPLRHITGALPDAWYLRTEGWTMDRILHDARSAVKSLLRKPFFTALAGITLAVGIGANTAIFSVVDSVLLNPLPYPDSDEILSVNHTAPGIGIALVPQSRGSYLHYVERFRTLEAFAVWAGSTVNLVSEAGPRRLRAESVTQEFFDVMGVHPVLGRGFAPGEDRPGSEPTVVLSHGLWQQDFGGDPDILGTTLELSGVHRRVIGIMPGEFQSPQEAELWIPMTIDPADPRHGSFGLIGMGRMAEGETVASVQAEMNRLMEEMFEADPEEFPRDQMDQAGLAPDVKPLKALFVEDLSQALWVLLGTVGFVLLIACANVANLFLVRAEARRREHALRSALGAGRGDMIRYYLTESVTLGVGSGLLGLGLAYGGVKALLAMAPVAVPRASEIGMDGSVLLFTAVISLASGLLFGLFPAFGAGGRDLSGMLKEGGRSSTDGRERHRVRSTLVVAQVALALVLLVGSGLMARSFMAMRSIDPGFDSQDRLTFQVALPNAEYPDEAAVRLFDRRLQERLAAIPGVRHAALISAVPLDDTKNASPMEAEDNPMGDDELGVIVDRRLVTPGALEALGIPLVEGRELTWDDSGDGVRSAVISETTARTFWPGEASVVGRRIRNQGNPDNAWEVVGVAEDIRFETLTDEPAPLIYVPMIAGSAESPEITRSFAAVLHVAADPLSFVAAAREALQEVDPRLPMIHPRTVAQIQGDAMAATSFTVVLLGIAAGIALLLGTVGIYGVISYVVSRRTQEIGVRMALGAPASRVLRSVVGQGMALAGVGLAVGLLGAWGVSRVLTSLLYGVSATDPFTYAGTAALLGLVAFLASIIPARKAARVDIVNALKAE